MGSDNLSTSQTRLRSAENSEDTKMPPIDPMENLSYVAFQRKNLDEERRKREAQADACLQKYQDDKDKFQMELERRDKEVKIDRAREVAAFNLNTSLNEKARTEITDKAAKAYIFKNRPLTPARFQKQLSYSYALGEQVEKKNWKKLMTQQEIDRADREEQIHLSKEIAEEQRRL